jgi:hypothetical protein
MIKASFDIALVCGYGDGVHEGPGVVAQLPMLLGGAASRA